MNCIIMRGLPGSGKTTWVQDYIDAFPATIVCSADNFPGYYTSGLYRFSPEIAKLAHKWCRDNFDLALDYEVPNIIVDNTNVTFKQYQYYYEKSLERGYNVRFEVWQPQENILATYAARNKHGVTLDILQRMFGQWEVNNVPEQ